MGGFRRAQLRGSEELFRTTEQPAPVEQDLELTAEVPATPVVNNRPAPAGAALAVVPNLPAHNSRSLRLTVDELQVIADALQHLKFPNKPPVRPSVDDFERLEELRQRLLESI